MQTQALSVIASSPTLTGVPLEIFELIASHVDDAELRSLRLTCHTSAAKVMRPFARKHFNSRTILLCDQESIEDALRAAKHPDFGRHLTDLAIYADVYADGVYHSEGPVVPTSPSATQAPARDHNLGGCQTMLEHLFRVIQQREVGLRRLALFDENADEEGCYSKLRVWRNNLLSNGELPAPDDTAPQDAVMKAVFATDLRVHEVLIRTDNWFPVRPSTSSTPNTYLPLLRGFMSHVGRLDLCMLERPWASRSDVVSSIVDMLTAAPYLRSLRLQLGQDPNDEVATALKPMLEKGLLSLHHLSLERAWLNMRTLLTFVQRCPSLRTLDLVSVDFMRGSFGEDVMGDFEFRCPTQIDGLVRKVVGLPGHYEDLWSDDVALRV